MIIYWGDFLYSLFQIVLFAYMMHGLEWNPGFGSGRRVAAGIALSLCVVLIGQLMHSDAVLWMRWTRWVILFALCYGGIRLLYRTERNYAFLLSVSYVFTRGLDWPLILYLKTTVMMDPALFSVLTATLSVVTRTLAVVCVRYFGRVPDPSARVSGRDFVFILLLISPVFIIFMSIKTIDIDYSVPSNAVLATIMCLCSLVSIIAALRHFKALSDSAHLQQSLNKAQAQCESLRRQQRSDQEVRCLYHDMRHYISLMTASAPQQEELDACRQKIETEFSRFDERIHTGNETLDLLLVDKVRECGDRGIDVHSYVDFSKGGFMEPLDICNIVSNALENAMEALESVPRGDRFIDIRASVVHGHLVMRFENPMAGPLRYVDGRLASTKDDPYGLHGYGISSIRHSAQKYGGTVSVEAGDAVFTLTVLLPVPPESDGSQSQAWESGLAGIGEEAPASV